MIDDGPTIRGILLAWAVLLVAHAALFSDPMILPSDMSHWVLRAWIAITEAGPVPDSGREAFQAVSMLLRGSFAVAACVLVARAFPAASAAEWRLGRLIAYPVSIVLLVRILFMTSAPQGGCAMSATESFILLLLSAFALIFPPLIFGLAIWRWSAPRSRRWRAGRQAFTYSTP